MPGGLLTDLYELNMAASYMRRGMWADATFSLFVRNMPPDRGFLVAAGLEDVLAWLEGFGFDEEDLDYLVGVGFDRGAVDAFAGLRFDGEVWAVPEGRIVCANEPIIEITAPIPVAQLVETYVLNQISFQTTIATKAARCRIAAAGRIELVDFAFRRTQGIEAGMAVARLSAMMGFASTSNVEAAHRYGLTPAGTMAHSYIQAFPSEMEAFTAFARDMPERTTFLVDTYDNRTGILHAIEVIRRLGLEDRSGIRLDSGDLESLAFEARTILDDAGLANVRIFVSGGLDEHDIARLVSVGAPVDAAGIGTRMGVSADAPYVDSAYKLVSYEGRPVAKLSTGKATLPGAKQVFRGDGLSDLIGSRSEPVPPATVPLLEPVMRYGKRLSDAEHWPAGRRRFEADLELLPGESQELVRPVPLRAGLTPALRDLDAEVASALLAALSAPEASRPS